MSTEFAGNQQLRTSLEFPMNTGMLDMYAYADSPFVSTNLTDWNNPALFSHGLDSFSRDNTARYNELTLPNIQPKSRSSVGRGPYPCIPPAKVILRQLLPSSAADSAPRATAIVVLGSEVNLWLMQCEESLRLQQLAVTCASPIPREGQW